MPDETPVPPHPLYACSGVSGSVSSLRPAAGRQPPASRAEAFGKRETWARAGGS